MQETQVSCLGWENPLAIQSMDRSLAGYSPWDLRVGHDWMTDWLIDNGFHNSHHSENIPGPCHAFISPGWYDFPTPYLCLNSFSFLLPPLQLLARSRQAPCDIVTYNRKCIFGPWPISGTKSVKLLELPVMGAIKVSLVLLMRWLLYPS